MDKDLAAIVEANPRDAMKINEGANDLQLAHYIATKTNCGGRTDPSDRSNYELALAQVVRVRRHTVA